MASFRIRVRIEEIGPHKELKDALRDARGSLVSFNARYTHFDYPLGKVRQIFFEVDAIRRKLPTKEQLEAARRHAPLRFRLGRYEGRAAALGEKVDGTYRQLERLLKRKESEVATRTTGQ